VSKNACGGAPTNLAELPNIGPKTAERLRRVGIGTPAELRRIGAVEAFDRVEQAFPESTTLVLLYALEGALRNVPWTALTSSGRAVHGTFRSAPSSA